MQRGYIKLWRCIQNNPMWNEDKFSRGQAWLDLVLLANHKDSSVRKRGIKIDVSRGQAGWSERQLADRWQWSRGKVKRFLDELESDQQIGQQNGPQNLNVTSLITIVNYEKYQGDEPQNRPQIVPQTGHKQATNSTMNKNEKNEKKELLAKAPRKPRAPSGDHQVFISWWCMAFDQFEEKKYLISGKDAKHVADILKTLPLRDTIWRAISFFRSTDPFYEGKRDLPFFRSQINKVPVPDKNDIAEFREMNLLPPEGVKFEDWKFWEE